jgi:hypothetical protein
VQGKRIDIKHLHHSLTLAVYRLAPVGTEDQSVPVKDRGKFIVIIRAEEGLFDGVRLLLSGCSDVHQQKN